MRIVVLDGYTLFADGMDHAPFSELGEAVFYDRTPQQLVMERISDAEIVLTNKTKITREVMDACPQMKYIGVLATGYNVVDVEEAAARGIIVTNVPAYSTQAVAQHTMALLLAHASRVQEYDAAVKNGGWIKSLDFCFYVGESEELAGKTMGIVGFGSIGQAVARAAAALGMRVIAHTRTPRTGYAGVEFVPLSDLLAQSDVISLHCPLTEKTQGMISEVAIRAMKDGVLIINTARGPLVDEEAMAHALESGKIGCYMADVLSSEPPQEDNPLLHAPRTIITPHVAWAPRQTRERLRDVAAGNVRAYLDGTPRNVVGP